MIGTRYGYLSMERHTKQDMEQNTENPPTTNNKSKVGQAVGLHRHSLTRKPINTKGNLWELTDQYLDVVEYT